MKMGRSKNSGKPPNVLQVNGTHRRAVRFIFCGRPSSCSAVKEIWKTMQSQHLSRSIQNRPHRLGFTLLEMMLVLLIIGALVAAVAYNFAGAGERAKARTTKIALTTLKGALFEYNSSTGSYPSTIDGLTVLVPSYVEAKAIKDSWKRPFQYFAPTEDPNRPYDMISMGSDGLPNTMDDISVWDED